MAASVKNAWPQMSLSFKHEMLELFTQSLLTLTSKLYVYQKFKQKCFVVFFHQRITPFQSCVSSSKLQTNFSAFFAPRKMMPIRVYVGYYYESTRMHKIKYKRKRGNYFEVCILQSFSSIQLYNWNSRNSFVYYIESYAVQHHKRIWKI